MHKRSHDNLPSSASSSKKPRLEQDGLAPTDFADDVNESVVAVMKRKHRVVIGQDLSEPERLKLFQAIISSYLQEYPALKAYCVSEYTSAAKLLQDNFAFLGPELDEAWKTGSFTKITSSVFFQKGPGRPQADLFHFKEQVDVTELAWKTNYKGIYADVLKDTIITEKSKANFLTVIQSSGTGKSRTVYEVGKSLFSVYINLREASGTGFPNRDPALCDFIAQAKLARRNRFYCAAFLCGIFDAAISLLGTETLTPEAFRTRLDANRSAFDAEAAKSADRYVAVDVPMGNQANPMDDPEYYALVLHLIGTIKNFARAANLSEHSDAVLLIVDECHTLHEENGISTYHAFCSLLRDLRTKSESHLFVIFISTMSQTRRLAPAPADDPSKRVSDGLPQLDPYTAFPFDVETNVITENTMKVEKVCELQFLCSFGRPLWLSRYESGTASVREKLVDFAKSKLHGNDNHTEDKDDAKFAALSTRHLLTFEPDRRPCGVSEAGYQKISEMEYKQVASHMRIVHSIPSHRQYMRTGTPSEPILAEAAAQLYPDGRQHVRFLAEELNPLVSKGERGELAARLLCNLAHDAAVLKHPRSPSPHNIQYSRPIPLIIFLEALISPQFHAIVLDSCPKGGVPLRQAFKHSCVHFTHWAKMGDASCLSTQALWKAAARGIAWQCCDNMAEIDQMLPIILDSRKELGRGNISALVIQDKNVATPKITRLNRKFGSILFADAPGETVQPFIFLTMQLGARPTKAGRRKTAGKQQETPSSPPSSPSKTTVPTASTSTMTLRNPQLSQQYDITITGCSPKVYSVIHNDDRPRWAQLLSTRSFGEEHPRQHDPRHLDLLKRSKPFFWAGEASFDWAKDSDSQQDEEEQIDDEDEVTVGCEQQQEEEEEEE